MKLSGVMAVVAGIGMLASPTGLDSCAILPPEPLFATRFRPADVENEFARGRIGVLQRTFGRPYLIAAYRILSGGKLSQKEVEAISPGRAATNADETPRSGEWYEARNRVASVKPFSVWDVYRSKSADGLIYSYRNCLDDAFDTARRTLEQRVGLWGRDSPLLRDWIAAQDQVFSNCSGKDATIPSAATKDMDPLLAADREYQIAAANFYAGEWQKARDGFERVAQNTASPWRKLAAYLVARTFLREGMVESKVEPLREAERRLQAIARDPAQQEWRAASLRLVDFVRVRIDPFKRLEELGSALLLPDPYSNVAVNMGDFTYLFQTLADGQSNKAERIAATSELADWLLSLDGRTENSATHALEKWRASRNHAWMIAALLRVTDKQDISEVVEAARQTRPDEPAYESAAYYGIAHLIQSGDRDGARVWADKALRQKLLRSSRNLILAERLKLARDFSEFLRYAPREPEPILADFDGSDVEFRDAKNWMTPLFDHDATSILNTQVPLSLWREAADNALLAAHLRIQLAQAGWVRAFVLNKNPEARNFMERIVQLQPKAREAARDLLTATDSESSRFAGAFLLLRTRGMAPRLYAGSNIVSHLETPHHSGTGFWWPPAACAPIDFAEFLTAAQRLQGGSECKQIAAAVPCGSSYLAAEAVLWARKHGDDPRTPEALYLAVQATRRGCKDARTGELSHQAFILLKQRYPSSEWGLRTKYWYK